MKTAWVGSVGRLCAAAWVVCLVGCAASGPKTPDWRLSAVDHVERFRDADLKGHERVAAHEFELARVEVSRTARPELLARIELNRCAVHVARLDFSACTGFDPLAQDADAGERAYARYLAGQADAADAPLLPQAHRAIARGGVDVAAIADPLARLIAAGVLRRQQRANGAVIAQAVDTASAQGWSRPLLAWLDVQLEQAVADGDVDQASRLRRRLDVLRGAAPSRD